MEAFLDEYKNTITAVIAFMSMLWVFLQMKIMKKQRDDLFYDKQLNFVTVLYKNHVIDVDKVYVYDDFHLLQIEKNLRESERFIKAVFYDGEEKVFNMFEFITLNRRASFMIADILFYTQYILDQIAIFNSYKKNTPYKKIMRHNIIKSYNRLIDIKRVCHARLAEKVMVDRISTIDYVKDFFEIRYQYCLYILAMHDVNKVKKIRNKTCVVKGMSVNAVINIYIRKRAEADKENGATKCIDVPSIEVKDKNSKENHDD